MPKQQAETLHDLLILKLKALYDVETQLTKALPKMAKKADNEDLRIVFEEHLEETETQVERLEECFKLLGIKPAKTKVEAIRGMIADAEWVMKNVKDPQARDAAMIGAAQYVEHYEIAGYGTAAEWAELMDHADVKALLGETLEEEDAADEKLSDLAVGMINEMANDMDSEEEE